MLIEGNIGRLSDLTEVKHRADWSELRSQIAGIEPGQRLTLHCPPERSMGAFRSTVITTGKRLHTGDRWQFTTRTENRTLHCFLSPR